MGFQKITAWMIGFVGIILSLSGGYWYWHQQQKPADQPYQFGGNYYKQIPDTRPTQMITLPSGKKLSPPDAMSDEPPTIGTYKGVPTGDEIISGQVLIRSIDGKQMTIQSVAQSHKGNITQMMIWTDTAPGKKWQPFSTLIKLPVSDHVYAQYKDEFNNMSPVYSDSSLPEQGPPSK